MGAGRRTVTITLTDELVDLLDAIALVDGLKGRAGAARFLLYRQALDRADDPGIRAALGAREVHRERRSGEVTRRGHLALLAGGAG